MAVDIRKLKSADDVTNDAYYIRREKEHVITYTYALCHMYIVINLEDNLMAMLGLHSDQSIAIHTQNS